MHLLLLLSGLCLPALFSLIRARPIMLGVNSGRGISLANNRLFSDKDNIDIDLGSHLIIRRPNQNPRQGIDTYVSRTEGYVYERNDTNLSFTPDYMLELYDKLSKGSSTAQISNIARSFKNIPLSDRNETGNTRGFRNYRVHSLVFDISALDLSERVTSAELRLYTLIQRDQRSYIGVNRVVTIYEILDTRQMADTGQRKYRHITSKYIYGVENSWESFDVTDALKRSMQLGLRTERFEVRIQTLLMDTGRDDMDINADPNHANQPLLVVYSNDNSIEHEHDVERHEMILHELSSGPSTAQYTSTGTKPDSMYGYNEQNRIHSRAKRSRGAYKSSICKRRPLYVNFEDIGWHTWIIAPRGFQAYQCAGKCTFPLSEHLSPSKHAVIQTLMHTIHPKRTARSCCVPTKLDPISILYFDEQGVVTYKYRYDGMVVAECGCR